MHWLCKKNGKNTMVIYFISILLSVCQSFTESLNMQILPRVLILLTCSGLYIFFSWHVESVLLPATCTAIYLLNTVVFFTFSWISFVQVYILSIIIFVLYTTQNHKDNNELPV